jgi:regulator of replication initiation timing
MDLMQRRLGDVSTRLNHVMKVAQARDADQKKMMRDLISENTSLRVENNGLKQQVSELTEMINGAPV